MVTTETLAKLWDSGVGANVELLEDVLTEVKEAYEFGVVLMDPELYREYVGLLGHFRASKVLEMESVRIPVKPQYSSPQEFLRGSEGEIEVMAHMSVSGVKIKGVYRFGRLMGVSAGEKAMTGVVKSIFPESLEECEELEYVEIEGVIGDYSDRKNLLRNTVAKLRRRIETGLEVYVHRVYGMNHRTLQEELKFLYGKGFKIPNTVTTVGSDVENMVEKVQKFFEGLADKGLSYEAEGIKLRINDNSLYKSYGSKEMLISKGQYWEDCLKVSTIERIEFKDDGMFKVPEAKIKPVEIFEGKVVEAVGLKSVGVMERYGFTSGAKVYFRYNNRWGIQLCDSKGKIIA